jgi:hypothetical protein
LVELVVGDNPGTNVVPLVTESCLDEGEVVAVAPKPARMKSPMRAVEVVGFATDDVLV